MLFIVNRYMFLLYIISQSAMDLPGTSEDAQYVSHLLYIFLADANICCQVR